MIALKKLCSVQYNAHCEQRYHSVTQKGGGKQVGGMLLILQAGVSLILMQVEMSERRVGGIRSGLVCEITSHLATVW